MPSVTSAVRVLTITLLIATCFSFTWYQERIPNGVKVPNPCSNASGVWKGVGHNQEPGGGPMNVFGKDFQATVHKWSKDLCMKDSDSDGRTNGVELGDPNCTWVPGQTPQGNAIGHPGVCEPMSDGKCTKINENIKC